MSLNLKSPEAHRLAAELARLTCESMTKAVTEAIRERVVRETRRRHAATLGKEFLAIGRRCATHMSRPALSLDHGDLFYNERGLPE